MASEKIAAMIEEVKSMTVLELSELVHALEEDVYKRQIPWRPKSPRPFAHLHSQSP